MFAHLLFAALLSSNGSGKTLVRSQPGTLVPVSCRSITNYALRSEDFAAGSWATFASTVIRDQTASPVGDTTADKYYPSASNPYVQQQVTAPAGLTAASVYVKANSWRWVALSVYDTAHHRVWFDLLNGTIGTKAAGTAGAIWPIGDGWYRIANSYTTAAANPYLSLTVSDADNSTTATPSGTNGVFLWGAQVESGPSAHRYVPTVATAVTACR